MSSQTSPSEFPNQGGALLQGSYDEAAAAAEFAEAVRSWRAGGRSTGKSLASSSAQSGSEVISGGGSGQTGGTLLQGAYNEAENAADFARAVEMWRQGGTGPDSNAGTAAKRMFLIHLGTC